MRAMEALNASGVAYLSHTKVEGVVAMLAVGSWRTTRADLLRTWAELQRLAGGMGEPAG
ncbi:MAG TPA: hypothetical protein VGJ41_08175 [Nocardioides sp.]|jgi:aromatic-L-amino-acid decarboxylase